MRACWICFLRGPWVQNIALKRRWQLFIQKVRNKPLTNRHSKMNVSCCISIFLDKFFLRIGWPRKPDIVTLSALLDRCLVVAESRTMFCIYLILISIENYTNIFSKFQKHQALWNVLTIMQKKFKNIRLRHSQKNVIWNFKDKVFEKMVKPNIFKIFL